MRTDSKAGLTALVAATLVLSLGACATPDTPDGDTGGNPFDIANLDLEPGADIPAATLRMGIEPFTDHSIPVIGMAQGWFDEVGIEIQPKPFGETVQPDQVVPRLTQGDLDVATWYAPSAIQALDAMPDMRLFAFHDIVLGRYVLANPALDTVSITDLVDGGASFEDAAAEAVGQLEGRSLAIGQDTSLNAYLNLLLGYSDVELSDIDIKSIDDNSQIALAKGGNIDFVAPLGLAAMAAVMNLGWEPIARIDDLITEFGADDPNVRTALGNTALAATEAYVNENPETILRMASVLFRSFDQIHEEPNAAYEHLIPFLSSIAGVELAQEEVNTVFTELDPVLTFEEQREFWQPQGLYYYKDLYTAVVEDNVAAGVISGEHDLESIFVGGQVFHALEELKSMYDELLEDSASLSGADQDVVEAAEQQYENRNYLDAYRMLLFATQ